MLNDFAKPKALSPFSEYDISLCIHNYVLCINEWFELSKKQAYGLNSNLKYRNNRWFVWD